MAIAETDQAIHEPSTSAVSHTWDCRFRNLRGVRWRINLGILPSSPSSSVDDFRRVTADTRRRYAALRRQLLVDTHVPKDGSNSPDPAIDNPLSQNPDSTWGRFFRNAELERTLDQDLSRLYPEHESYFQEPGFQGMLRRILMLWCLRRPDFSYRQGMHELLAPLLYVLHVDVEHLSEVRKNFEDHFTDRFDDLAFQENELTYGFDFKRFLDSMEDEIGSQGSLRKTTNLHEPDPEIQAIVLLSDAYGAEGELGIVLSERFMEHDAYCMFDALMSGTHGSVAVAEFFAYSPPTVSLTGLPSVIEASAALYNLLSIVDLSLHSHLVELGVEPQYFALRWLRVLFGREFSLENLLIVWDEIFSADNNKLERCVKADSSCIFAILSSPRGALIAAMAVSMILYLRSSLLGTENATSALQRLLNFPEDIDLKKIVEKARSLQAHALDVKNSTPLTNVAYNPSKAAVVRGHTLSVDSISLKTPLTVLPGSYWEEKWRDLHKAEELKQSSLEKRNPIRKKGWSERVRLGLSRAESDPYPAKIEKSKKQNKSSVRRSLLEDLSQHLGSEEVRETAVCPEIPSQDNKQADDASPLILSQDAHNSVEVKDDKQMGDFQEFGFVGEDSSGASVAGEEHSSLFSDTSSPLRGPTNHQNNLGRSSIALNLSCNDTIEHKETTMESSIPVSHLPGKESLENKFRDDSGEKMVAVFKEKKLLSSKLQWFWKFGRNSSGEDTHGRKVGIPDAAKMTDSGFSKSDMACSSTAGCFCDSSSSIKVDEQNAMGTLRNLGQSMLEHIQVIESAFQQAPGQVGSLENLSNNGLVEKGQVTAMTALKELRRISNLLSEM